MSITTGEVHAALSDAARTGVVVSPQSAAPRDQLVMALIKAGLINSDGAITEPGKAKLRELTIFLRAGRLQELILLYLRQTARQGDLQVGDEQDGVVEINGDVSLRELAEWIVRGVTQ
jgi:hypothetical protein